MSTLLVHHPHRDGEMLVLLVYLHRPLLMSHAQHLISHTAKKGRVY